MALPADYSAARILIIRLSALGDVIRTLPLLPPLAARFPDASLAWLCEPLARPLVEAQRLVDEVIEFPRGDLAAAAAGNLRRLARGVVAVGRRLRAAAFDLVIDAQGTYKSGLLARLTGAPVRVGFGRGAAKEYLPGAATHAVDPGPEPRSRVQKALALLAPLGADPGLAAAGLPENGAAAAEARRVWAGAAAGRRVVLAPGASARQSYKRWPAERFAGLARRLTDDGATVRVAWGPGEEELARRIAVQAGGAGLVLPSTSLLLLAEILRQADLFVGNDSGPMHLAWLVGTRVVALYGPTDPVVNAPWGRGHRQVAVPAETRGARRKDATLMERIAVDEVLAAARASLLEGAG